LIVSKLSLLIGIAAFIAAFIYGFYNVAIEGSGEAQFFIIWIAFMAAMSMETKPMIQDDKDDVKKFLKLLPVKPSKIVAAKFIFVNLIYVTSTIIAVIYLLLLKASFPAVITLTVGSQLFSIAISLLIINIFITGYYILGAANMQYILLAGFLLSFLLFKYASSFFVMPYSLIVIGLAVIICVLLYLVACKAFERKPN
jgi:hypothetical protein